MEKINFDTKIINKKNLDDTKKKIVDELLSKSFIKEKIKELNIGMKEFNKYLGYFVSYAENYELFQNLKKGEWKEKTDGLRLDLVLDEDGEITREYYLCDEKMEEIKINKNYIIRDFNEKYLDVSPYDLDGRKGRLKLETEICNIDMKNDIRGIYAYGKSGTGKSFPFIALCNSFVRKNRTCAFVDVKSFIESLKATFGSNGDEYNFLMDKVKNADILVLDDLGEEKASEWVRDDILSSILDYRNKNDLTTFITSSYSIDDIRKIYYDAAKQKNSTNKLRNDKFIDKILQSCKEIIEVL